MIYQRALRGAGMRAVLDELRPVAQILACGYLRDLDLAVMSLKKPYVFLLL